MQAPCMNIKHFQSMLLESKHIWVRDTRSSADLLSAVGGGLKLGLTGVLETLSALRRGDLYRYPFHTLYGERFSRESTSADCEE